MDPSRQGRLLVLEPAMYSLGQPMMPQSPSGRHTMPASSAGELVQLVARWGVTAEDLLAGSGLTEDGTQDPHARISVETFAALNERARVLTGEPGLGFYLGLQKRISMYGYLGFAAMSAASLREALDIVIQFMPTLTTAISLTLRVEGPVASLIVHEFVDLGSAHDVALISLMVGMRQIGTMLTGLYLGGEYANLALPEPDYFHRFRHLVPDTRFDQPVSELVFDAAYLDLPLALANRSALRLARAQCERALDSLGYEGDMVERARRALSAGSTEGYRSLRYVAKALGVSPRTLKRKLAVYGVSFTSLLERERREKAIVLLQAQNVSLESVAEQLGYSTLSSFVRAFHRWTGHTPALYRRERLATLAAPRESPPARTG